jgi:hypothetical protein
MADSTLDRIRSLESAEEESREFDFRVAGDQIVGTSAETVRPDHIRSAMRDLDAIQSYHYEDLTAFVGTKRIEARNPFILIVIGREEDGARVAYLGYRLYEGNEDLEDDPSAALAAFIDRFGLMLDAGQGNEARFVPSLRAKPDAEGNVSIIGGVNKGDAEKWTLAGFTKADTERQEAVTMFAFGVDLGRYADEVKRLSGA